MPRIQSRLHVDELQTTKQSLAACEEENKALVQRLREQHFATERAERQAAVLSNELAQAQADVASAHQMLTGVQTRYEERERGLQEQVRRMGLDIHTLEEMVQAARRRETANARDGPCERCSQLRKDLLNAKEEIERMRKETREPSCPLRCIAGLQSENYTAAASSNALAVPSSRSFYWQEQLLKATQQAAACFSVIQHQTHDLCVSLSSDAAATDATKSERQKRQSPGRTLDECTERWAHQLQRLQSEFNEVVQADAKLISFLVLVAEQQSSEITRLQQQWSEAQQTLRDVEKVMDEAQERVHAREQEVVMLRSECATLTDAHLRHQTQLAAQARELHTYTLAFQKAEETHTKSLDDYKKQVESLTARLAQITKLQQQATAYAEKLEAALQEKQHLLESAVAARNAQQQREIMAAAEARVAQFVSQLSQSAEQLQTSLTHLSASTSISSSAGVQQDLLPPSSLSPGVAHFKVAPSVSYREPSSPNRLSAAGVSLSPSLTRTGTRSPSSAPYDDSICLADFTHPFSFDK